MKKLLSVLLVLVLLFTFVLSASAETCYETVKELLSSYDAGDLYLGKPITTSSSDTGKLIFLTYYADENILLITGKNARGAGETAGWLNVDFVKGIYVIYALCGVWDSLQSLCDYGYSVCIACRSGETELFITSALEAKQFISTLEDMLK